ncbi:23S rRNA (adenine(2503)-C(2))-methyltransferase RlmN [Bacteriovorax sp. PP10]|uniref:23S rRNA (Adenine(2503)-C(2))-methyltransferase RlmN n=1 Tax=Bacteriovorax antarcticus TaxID=3088717 RepID=A0ABU5VVZ2_9BACT|nr:23S rRNA (adenine(2503)-C(2))-methyltransferase RlmN [Bacteriovorax sp. PP10]MEA9355800.1 23S rRNA (adenine(2503)-C(2))-methyltransferase RlmN [Bacteriovorax sp. PP10]
MTLEKSIYELTEEELKSFLSANDISPDFSATIFRNLYKKNKHEQPISKKIMALLSKNFTLDLPKIHTVSKSPDGTVKFLMEFSDGKSVETVLIPFHKRFTVCLSSQVGCAMKCSFCYTGTMGLSRHLKSSEIIGQYIVAANYLDTELGLKTMSPNIVFMGQGEPLHNSTEVLKAINVFMEPLGLGMGPRQMTLSTAGYLPGIKKLNDFPKINIALSLHSPFNDIRKELIPINQHFPLEDIFEALDGLDLMKRQFIVYEYLLIDGLNDRVEDADELLKLLGERKSAINIIPFNPFPGSKYKRPSDARVEEFKEMLVERKLRTMIRTTKGSDILAACGQLKS